MCRSPPCGCTGRLSRSAAVGFPSRALVPLFPAGFRLLVPLPPSPRPSVSRHGVSCPFFPAPPPHPSSGFPTACFCLLPSRPVSPTLPGPFVFRPSVPAAGAFSADSVRLFPAPVSRPAAFCPQSPARRVATTPFDSAPPVRPFPPRDPPRTNLFPQGRFHAEISYICRLYDLLCSRSWPNKPPCTAISTIAVRFLNYLLTPYFTRVFGQETYGVMVDVYALIPFALVLLSMGMESGYFRFATRAEQAAAMWRWVSGGFSPPPGASPRWLRCSFSPLSRCCAIRSPGRWERLIPAMPITSSGSGSSFCSTCWLSSPFRACANRAGP